MTRSRSSSPTASRAGASSTNRRRARAPPPTPGCAPRSPRARPCSHAPTPTACRAPTGPPPSGGRSPPDGLDLVGGELVPRRDEGLPAPTRWLLRGAVHLAEAFGRVRPGNRDPEYRGPYMMAAGCNVGITAELYVAAGGFPRTAIEDLHEDRALVNAVRKLTDRLRATQRCRRVRVVPPGAGMGAAEHAALVQGPRLPTRARGHPVTITSSPPPSPLAAQWEERVMRGAHPVAYPCPRARPPSRAARARTRRARARRDPAARDAHEHRRASPRPARGTERPVDAGARPARAAQHGGRGACRAAPQARAAVRPRVRRCARGGESGWARDLHHRALARR